MFSQFQKIIHVGIIIVILTAWVTAGAAQAGETLPAPIVRPPIHSCALAVYVYGCVPGSTVTVYVNGTQARQVLAFPGFGNISLPNPLNTGDIVTATQSIRQLDVKASIVSPPSSPVTVTPYPEITTPVVEPSIYACGQVVIVANVLASTHVEVFDNDSGSSTPIGTAESTGDTAVVITSPLVANHHLYAIQVECPDSGPTPSAKSQLAPVLPAPIPTPLVAADPAIPGNNRVYCHNLLIGAAVTVSVGATVIGSGLVDDPNNYVPVQTIVAGSTLTVIQTLCTASKPTSVPTTGKLEAPLLDAPICPGSNIIAIDNTTPSALVTVTRAGTTVSIGAATPGRLYTSVDSGVTLNDGDVLTATQAVGGTTSPVSNSVTVGCSGGANVITHHNDNNRTGDYLNETTLTPANVLADGMQLKWTQNVTGGILAQGLYVHDAPFAALNKNKTTVVTASALFVATTSNVVYALNASTGAPIWQLTLPDGDPKSDRTTALGITATPVVDVPNHTMYVLYRTWNGVSLTDYGTLGTLDTAYWLAAIDYLTGTLTREVLVSASPYRTDGTVVKFLSNFQVNHVAMLYDHGTVYIGFGDNAELENSNPEYHGWVFAYRASDFAQQSVFCTSKDWVSAETSGFAGWPGGIPAEYLNEEGAGIWGGGAGISADPDGNIYFLTGNGTADSPNYKYGDTFMKLTPTVGGLLPSPYVPPDALTCFQNDADLGGGGTLTIPNTNDVIGGGKSGYMYRLNTTDMTFEQQISAATNQYDPTMRDTSWNGGPHTHGSPTYWRGPDQTYGYIYVWGEKDFLRQYQYDVATGAIGASALNVGTVDALNNVMPGGMISVSANGNTAGTGILWITLPAADTNGMGAPTNPGTLYAYNAETLKPLWNSPAYPATGNIPSLAHWQPPTIADGTVFVGTNSNEVMAYDLAPASKKGGRHVPWVPFQPKSFRGGPMYTTKEEMLALPAIRLASVAPPAGYRTRWILMARGSQIYKAARGGWQWIGSSVSAYENRPERADLPIGQIRIDIIRDPSTRTVRIEASDGSCALAVAQKTVDAPDGMDAPWTLYRVIRSTGKGAFSDTAYIQCLYTALGQPPMTAPRRSGEAVRVRYIAQYIVFSRRR